jgi:hypothetical protein
MDTFRKRKQCNLSPERRRYPRMRSDGTRVHLHALGEHTQSYKVRDISRAGMFVETDTYLPLALPVELAFTCRHTYQLMKLYRRSAYIARTSYDGMVVLFFDKRLA